MAEPPRRFQFGKPLPISISSSSPASRNAFEFEPPTFGSSWVAEPNENVVRYNSLAKPLSPREDLQTVVEDAADDPPSDLLSVLSAAINTFSRSLLLLSIDLSQIARKKPDGFEPHAELALVIQRVLRADSDRSPKIAQLLTGALGYAQTITETTGDVGDLLRDSLQKALSLLPPPLAAVEVLGSRDLEIAAANLRKAEDEQDRNRKKSVFLDLYAKLVLVQLGCDGDGTDFHLSISPDSWEHFSTEARTDPASTPFVICVIGPTRAGKTELGRALLLIALDQIRYQVGVKAAQSGDVTVSRHVVSLTLESGQQIEKVIYLFDVEGFDASSAPEVLKTQHGSMNSQDDPVLDAEKRRNAGAFLFPRLAFAMADLVVCVSRATFDENSMLEPLKNFCTAVEGSTTRSPPRLMLIGNFRTPGRDNMDPEVAKAQFYDTARKQTGPDKDMTLEVLDSLFARDKVYVVPMADYSDSNAGFDWFIENVKFIQSTVQHLISVKPNERSRECFLSESNWLDLFKVCIKHMPHYGSQQKHEKMSDFVELLNSIICAASSNVADRIISLVYTVMNRYQRRASIREPYPVQERFARLRDVAISLLAAFSASRVRAQVKDPLHEALVPEDAQQKELKKLILDLRDHKPCAYSCTDTTGRVTVRCCQSRSHHASNFHLSPVAFSYVTLQGDHIFTPFLRYIRALFGQTSTTFSGTNNGCFVESPYLIDPPIVFPDGVPVSNTAGSTFQIYGQFSVSESQTLSVHKAQVSVQADGQRLTRLLSPSSLRVGATSNSCVQISLRNDLPPGTLEVALRHISKAEGQPTRDRKTISPLHFNNDRSSAMTEVAVLHAPESLAAATAAYQRKGTPKSSIDDISTKQFLEDYYSDVLELFYAKRRELCALENPEDIIENVAEMLYDVLPEHRPISLPVATLARSEHAYRRATCNLCLLDKDVDDAGDGSICKSCEPGWTSVVARKNAGRENGDLELERVLPALYE